MLTTTVNFPTRRAPSPQIRARDTSLNGASNGSAGVNSAHDVDAGINGATHLGGQCCGHHEDGGDSTNCRKLAEHKIATCQAFGLILWSILLFAGLTALGLCNIGFGGQIYADLQKMAALPPAQGEDQVDWGKLAGSYNFFPQMMAPFLTLLGFATASPVIATLIMRPASTAATEKAIVGDASSADYLDRNSSPSQAELRDLMVKEVAGHENLVDITRLQHVAITALL